MIVNEYLKWMAEETESSWCNDSAVAEDLESALASGAVGCTSNPPLTFDVLSRFPSDFSDEIADALSGIGVDSDARAVALIGVVVRRIAARLTALFYESGRTRGYIRAQVAPSLSADADGMLEMGKTFASWAPNIKVKIPGTAAGMRTLEELAALGIPTNPTVCGTISQMIAAAEANERGIKRAVDSGIAPAHSTSAFVLGRLQDYLAELNRERALGLAGTDLELAVLAVAKRCCGIFRQRGYTQQIMPAAFRSAAQVEGLAGSPTVMTIHPKIQAMVLEADRTGTIRRRAAFDDAVPAEIIERVLRAIPEFRLAYEPDALTPPQFDTFGATIMTLSNFDRTGWQKLRVYEAAGTRSANTSV